MGREGTHDVGMPSLVVGAVLTEQRVCRLRVGSLRVDSNIHSVNVY